jgi:predicted amidophosphoribosyltransferase
MRGVNNYGGKKMRCYYCKEEIADDALRCPHCGKPPTEETKKAAKAEAEQEEREAAAAKEREEREVAAAKKQEEREAAAALEKRKKSGVSINMSLYGLEHSSLAGLASTDLCEGRSFWVFSK